MFGIGKRPYRQPPDPDTIAGPTAWTQANYAAGTAHRAQDSDYALRYGYYPGYATLDGPHFRVGYHWYPGVTANYAPLSKDAANTRQLGGELIMRPPIIPRRNATIKGIGNALIFQLQYAASGGPQNVPYVQTPQLPRR